MQIRLSFLDLEVLRLRMFRSEKAYPHLEIAKSGLSQHIRKSVLRFQRVLRNSANLIGGEHFVWWYHKICRLDLWWDWDIGRYTLLSSGSVYIRRWRDYSTRITWKNSVNIIGAVRVESHGAFLWKESCFRTIFLFVWRISNYPMLCFIASIGFKERYKGSHEPLDKCNLIHTSLLFVNEWGEMRKCNGSNE